MSTYPNLKNEPKILKIKTNGDEIRDLKHRTEKHDYENILKSLNLHSENYKKKYKSLNKKTFMIVSETLIGIGGSSVGSGLTLSGIAPVGMVTVGSISFLSSISTLITNEFFSKLKIRYTKLRDCNNVTSLLFEKTMKESMIDKKVDGKQGEKLRLIFNHYINKQDEIKKSTQFKVEEVFGNVIPKDTFLPEQTTKLTYFQSE